jgi:RNA recognition motif-containing protein
MGKIPREVFEDELIPLLEECGTILLMRLMMDPITGWGRGFCFCTFSAREAALTAVRKVSWKRSLRLTCS